MLMDGEEQPWALTTEPGTFPAWLLRSKEGIHLGLSTVKWIKFSRVLNKAKHKYEVNFSKQVGSYSSQF